MTYNAKQLVKAVHQYYNGEEIDGFTEKILVEICAGANEGMSPKQLSVVLGIKPNNIKQVVKAAMKHESNQKQNWTTAPKRVKNG